MDTLNDIYFSMWTSVISALKNKTLIFQDNKPKLKNWICSGKSNGKYTMVLTQDRALVKLEFDHNNKDINDYALIQLKDYKEKMESSFGDQFNWLLPEKNNITNISFSKHGYNVHDMQSKEKMIQFLVENIIKLELATREALIAVKDKIAKKHFD